MEQREALRQETTKVIRETLEKMEDHKGHSAKKSKAEHEEGFKEAYFTEFLID
jgi:flagellar FliL protein